jgi:hypothetical protein
MLSPKLFVAVRDVMVRLSAVHDSVEFVDESQSADDPEQLPEAIRQLKMAQSHVQPAWEALIDVLASMESNGSNGSQRESADA